MARQSILEHFRPASRPPEEIAVVWKRSYRTVRWSYGDLLRSAARIAGELRARGLAKGERVLLWGPNSGEWMAAFLGSISCGGVAVPMDAIADRSFVQRVAQQAGARFAFQARELPALDGLEATFQLEEVGEAALGRGGTDEIEPLPAASDDPIEIVFTSGTTTEPRGVVLTHGNILANLAPIEKEFNRYRRYERLVHPLRFLDLLPLSHVFGQLLGIFLPQILGATSVFLETLNPAEVIRSIHEERVSLLVTVPRLVDSLREQLERDLAAASQLEQFRRDFSAAQSEHFLRRWWRFRAIRRRFGWKFWAIISGGAALPAEAEEFWTRLGYAVIQGYGLTETTSLISVNHPFRLERGSIGKALPGSEVKLSADGEILVRGANVAASYWKAAGPAPVLDAEGWFHTGDIGERDAAGHLYFKGRSKNVIVTPEGLNVYPEDLEAELRKEPAVRDCVVVGLERDGNAEPCAVLLLRGDSKGGADGSANVPGMMSRVNARLASFQQMRRWMVWPDQDFPRTPTQKPVLSRIRDAATAHTGGATGAPTVAGPLAELLDRISRGRTQPSGQDQRFDLSSIERVELLSALEDRYQVDLSESEFARADTVPALQNLLDRPQEASPPFHYPRWAQSWPVRAIRTAVFYLLARPAMLLLGWPRVHGRENLQDVRTPVIVVANHVAFFDPAYVREALPARLRNRLAVAMEGERLESMRNPGRDVGFLEALLQRASYWLVVSLFHVFPLPLHAGFRKSFSFVGDLVDRGWSVLIFPEGVMTKDGQMAPFHAGIGLLASQLSVPVVPVYLGGIFEQKRDDKHWAPPGKITVSIGQPEKFKQSDAAQEIAGALERRVAALADGLLQR